MANIKPAIPKGTRDFNPAEMARRNYIFDTIKAVFKKYGYQEIQTPTMENLDTLTGKYGDEGDKLIFKILESGEYASSINEHLVPNFDELIVPREDIRNDFLNIAADFAKQVSDSIPALLKEREIVQKDWLLSNLYSEIFDSKIKRVDFFYGIKNVFVNYLFSPGKTKKFSKFESRFKYYSEIKDIDLRLKEINIGFYYIVNNRRPSIKPFMNLELKARKAFTSIDVTPLISKKALRYDLTVPFARYVVMHQNDITLPFKRFQIQPVWRADRPQRGRYREFFQCDADVVGSESLLNEAEFVMIYQEALSKLGLKDFTIKLNNRKILSGIAEIIGKPELIVDMTVAIDKLDKIGLDGVTKELIERGFTSADIDKLKPIILLEGSNEEKLKTLKEVLGSSATGLKGISEIEIIFNYIDNLKSKIVNQKSKIVLDITLARGLNYYTGAIFEVQTNEVAMGSIGGGGRYDDLTEMFGLKGLTGVGISFGADRIYDVLEELNLFPESSEQTTKVLIVNFDDESELYALPILQQLRDAGVSSELYPKQVKLKKQMDYANDKKIPFVILIGSEEIQSGLLTLKDMQSGDQEKLEVQELIRRLK